MKYIEQLTSVGSYLKFTFTKHDRGEFCVGDQIWSDGVVIEIYDYCDLEILNELISNVDNKIEFIKDLNNSGFDGV